MTDAPHSALQALLSKIVGQTVDLAAIRPLELFTANLTSLLLGVASVDGQVSADEKQHLKTTLTRLRLLDGELGKLTRLMIQGINKQRIFCNLNHLLTLAEPLTKSQRLLLIGLGYEMSAADGSIDPKELKYLQQLAKALKLDPSHLQVFEACFAQQGESDPTALNEVHYLLDPARFHDLDIIFTEAASTLVGHFPESSDTAPAEESAATSLYADLDRFQETRNQLDQLYASVNQVIQDCVEENYVTETVVQDFEKAWERLRSQHFRIAVVGEFSQGKSTFLNALLGEKIQPARAIPCSGTLTVLRYGKQKRVLCRYRDGREEAIPIEQYQEKAMIPKDAAHGKESASQALTENEIDEIVFEHPELELCKNGVEIVDSPGLNEHDDRTRVTCQLLKGTDAVLFLANASRPLTQWEKNFLHQELRQRMRDLQIIEAGKVPTSEEISPADNLFILVNFMDLLDEESDRDDVQERFKTFLNGTSPVLTGENRIHYISAKSTLKASLKRESNEYTLSFQKFRQALETFLITERGNSKLRNAAMSLINLISHRLIPELQQSRAIQTNDIQLSSQDTQDIQRNISCAKSDLNEIQTTIEQIEQSVRDEVERHLEQWFRQTCTKVRSQSWTWTCGNSRDREAINRKFVELYQLAIANELDLWSKQSLSPLLEHYLNILDQEISDVLQGLETWFRELDQQVGSNFSKRLNYSSSSVWADLDDFSSTLGVGEDDWRDVISGVATIGAIGATIVGLFTGGILPAIAWGSSWIGQLFGKSSEEIQEEAREQVLGQGLEQLHKSMLSIQTQIDRRIQGIFQERSEVVQRRIGGAIDATQQVLAQTQKANSASQFQKQQIVEWIDQQTKVLSQYSQDAQAFTGDRPME